MAQRMSERAAVVSGNCSFSYTKGDTGNGTLDLVGGGRFCGVLPGAGLDASRSATYFASLLASPSQKSQAAFVSKTLS